MNLSLYKLRKKLNTDKSGQSSLVGVILASVIGTVIVGSLTQWYISMNKTMSGTNDRLEAMTIAMSEWQRLEHMSLDELEANRENYKNPYDVGEKFKVGVTLGEQGFFDEGKCNSLTGTYAGENANCFKDTIMTVYDKDGNAMYTTRSLPLSVSRDSFPEGTILPYTGDLAKIPHGWVLCDGTNGTPDLRGRFLEGTGSYSGEFKDAGLPNIKGDLSICNGPECSIFGDGYAMSGQEALGLEDYHYSSSWTGGELYLNPTKITFDASKSNPIYGRTETVQPKSYTVFYIMKTNQDFHYNHTNPADTPSFYTKEEVDQLLEDERKNVANNYLNKSSKEYVHNLSPNYGLGIAYSSEDKMLHGYVDGTEAPFAGTGGIGLPDWNNGVELAANVHHTIAEKGWVHWQLISSNTNSANIILYINGHMISWVTAYSSATYYSDDSAFIPVSPGDDVYSQGKPAHFTFYPLK